MDGKIETIFHELSHTISVKLSSETKRADEAEAERREAKAKYEALIEKLRVIVAELPIAANDVNGGVKVVHWAEQNQAT